MVDALARPQRNLAEGPAERAVEREDDPLGDVERAVRLHLHDDGGRRQGERLGARRRGRSEAREDGDDDSKRRAPPQNCTFGASRAAGSSISKYERFSKPNIPATTFVGTLSSTLSYVRTVSL